MAEALGRRDALRITAMAGVAAAFGGGLLGSLLREARLQRVSRTRTRMGTLVTLTVVHPDAGEADRMIGGAFDEMGRLEGILSRHQDTSALGRLNAEGILVDPPHELVSVLGHALRLADATGGAFDPTILPVLDVYRTSFEATGARPGNRDVDAALSRVGYGNVTVDGGEIRLARPDMGITLDGIAKGFIVDACVALLRSQGAERVLVDAGGDIGTSVAGGDEPWSVAVQDPHHPDRHAGLLALASEAIATSADYLNSFTLDRRDHHIIDPRTGRSPDEASSVSVVAPTAMEADGLSTAIMVMGPGPGVWCLDRTPDAEGVVVTKKGRRHASAGFSAARAV